jgi:hypothetical protein
MRAKCEKSFAWKKAKYKISFSSHEELLVRLGKILVNFLVRIYIQCKRDRLIRVCVRCNYTIRKSHRCTRASDKKRVSPLSNIVSWRLIFIQGKLEDSLRIGEKSRRYQMSHVYLSFMNLSTFRSNFHGKCLYLSDAC